MKKDIYKTPLKNIDEREILVSEFVKKESKNEEFSRLRK